jgi:hypothetical protein
MTASTQGSKVSWATQAAFGTAQTTGFKDVKIEGNPGVNHAPVGEGIVPQSLYADPNQKEKPIINKKAYSEAMTIPSLIRQPASAGTASWMKALFDSGGYVVVSVDDTVTTGTPAVGSFDASAIGAYAAGYGVNVELADGTWVPTLIADVTGSTITPVMDLPSAPASVGGALNKCLCITPGNTGSLAATKLLTLKAYIKAQDGGNDEIIVLQDGALTALGDLVLEPDQTVILEATIGGSDLDGSTGSLGTNDFSDGDNHRILHMPWAQFATADSNGGITAAYHKINKATFTWGITQVQLTGFGDATCKNNIQAYMQKVEPNKLVIEMNYDSQKLDDFTTITNPSKYVGIIQPGAAEADAAFALILPNAHQVEAPTIAPWDGDTHIVTVAYTGNPAGLGGATGDSQANQPFYFLIADRSA